MKTPNTPSKLIVLITLAFAATNSYASCLDNYAQKLSSIDKKIGDLPIIAILGVGAPSFFGGVIGAGSIAGVAVASSVGVGLVAAGAVGFGAYEAMQAISNARYDRFDHIQSMIQQSYEIDSKIGEDLASEAKHISHKLGFEVSARELGKFIAKMDSENTLCPPDAPDGYIVGLARFRKIIRQHFKAQ